VDTVGPVHTWSSGDAWKLLAQPWLQKWYVTPSCSTLATASGSLIGIWHTGSITRGSFSDIGVRSLVPSTWSVVARMLDGEAERQLRVA
jgi:hypothetical protein